MTAQNQQKFRFIIGEYHENLKCSMGLQPALNCDMDGVASNGVYTAMPWKHTGTTAAFHYGEYRKFDQSQPLLKDHKGNVTDCAFNPFVDSMLATSAADNTVKLWVMGKEPLKEHKMSSDATLKGHQKAVTGIKWHPHASNVLASMGQDNTCRIWDVENQKQTIMFDQPKDQGAALKWSPDGKTLSYIGKNKECSIFDPRSLGQAQMLKVHEGPKIAKCEWIDSTTLLTSGADKMNEREIFVWDVRNFQKPVTKQPLPSGVGVTHMFADQEHKLLFVPFRGELNVSIYQYNPAAPTHLIFLTNHSSPKPTKCFGPIPKWTYEPNMHEVTRFARCDNEGKLEYISYRSKNRTGLFQDELYPPFVGNTPCLTFDEWMNGTEKEPITIRITEDYKWVPSGVDVKIESKDPNVLALHEANKKIQALNSQISELETENATLKQGASKVVNPEATEKIVEKEVIREVEVEKIVEVVKEVEVEKIVEKEVVKEVVVEKIVEVPAAGQAHSHSLNIHSKPILGYWNIRGLGAPCRYLLHYCGIQFEDKMYAAGPKPEYSRQAWLDEKFNLGLEFPNLPYLIDDEIKLTETAAIMKYICAKWMPELCTTDPVTFARAEMIWDKIYDLKIKSTMPAYMGKGNQEIMDVCWPLIQTIVDQLETGRTWLCGEQLTWLDFYFFELVLYLHMVSGDVVMTHYAVLGQYVERFQQLERFRDIWADENKCMRWPFNGDMATIGGRDSASNADQE